jgi:hypothetical protein
MRLCARRAPVSIDREHSRREGVVNWWLRGRSVGRLDLVKRLKRPRRPPGADRFGELMSPTRADGVSPDEQERLFLLFLHQGRGPLGLPSGACG